MKKNMIVLFSCLSFCVVGCSSPSVDLNKKVDGEELHLPHHLGLRGM